MKGNRMYSVRPMVRLLFFVALVIVSAGVLFLSPAWAEGPDFGEVEDILGGRGKLLAADDMVVWSAFQHEPWTNRVLLTSDLKVSSNTVEDVVAPPFCSDSPPIFFTKIGRVFNLPNDVTVSLGPLPRDCSPPYYYGLYAKDPGGQTGMTRIPFSTPDETAWMALGDFDGDGYDEVLVLNPLPLTLRVFEPKDLTDLSQPFEKKGKWESEPVTASIPYSEPLVADLNGDGNLEVAWVDNGLTNMNSENITITIRIVTVCGGNLSASGGVCSGKSLYTVIEAPTLEVDVGTVPMAFDRFLAIKKILLTAGNYDGKVPVSGRLDEELFVALIPKVNATTGMDPPQRDTLIPLVYDFDQDMNAKPSPSNDWSKNKDPKLIIANTNMGSWGSVDSGRLNWFENADNVVMVTTIPYQLTVGTLTFGTDLTINYPKYYWDVQIPQGNWEVLAAKIGRFNPTSLEGPRGFDPQIAALYADGGSARVMIVSVDPDNFKISKASVTDVGALDTALPYGLAVGDLQGKSLSLGKPEIVRVSSHSQPSVILGMPPSHVDWITPAGTSSPEEFNFSVVPAEYFASYETKVTQQDQSSRKGTTSYAFSTKETVEGSVTFGIPHIDSVSESFKFSAEQSSKGFVDKKYDTYETEEFDVSVETLYGDQVWYTSSTFNVYYYRVLGETACPQGNPECEADQELPLYVQFSGPDRIVRTEINGATLEWFQPVHEPGNVLSYPWDLAQLKLRQPSFSPYTSENPTEWATDSSIRVEHANWTKGQGENKTVGQTSTYAFDTSVSASGEATFEGGSAGGKATLSLHTSKSLSTLNSESQDLGASTGVGVTKKADFKTPNLYQYSAQTFVFGQSAPVGTLQEISLGTDFQGPGQLQTAFTADPTMNGGAWWETGYPKPDVALNHPARWGFEGRNRQYEKLPSNCLPVAGAVAEQCTVYNKPDPSEPWTSQFYWMKGLLITPSDSKGAGPQLMRLREEEEVDLRVRVYNYSLTEMPEGTRVHVRFYGQEWHGVDPLADAFLIDEVVLYPIPAFNDPNPGSIGKPNWTIAKTTFTPTAAETGRYLVFWVVVWMEDQIGDLVKEMPGHGLTEIPGRLIDIGQAPIEHYSNNVGLYKQALFVAPKENPEKASGISELVLEDLIATPEVAERYGRVEVRGVLKAYGGSVNNITLFFYDGDPDDGGKAFDQEIISHIGAEESYSFAVPFQPKACGLRPIFVQAHPMDGATETLGTVDVVVCPPLVPICLTGTVTGMASEWDNGMVRLTGEFQLIEPLDLSTARLTIRTLLEEMRTRLVPETAGLELEPEPGSTMNRAVFKTEQGDPEVRVNVTIKENNILRLELQVERAAIASPRLCNGMPPKTELTTNILIEDGWHGSAHIWMTTPWRCDAGTDGTVKALWLAYGNRLQCEDIRAR